MDFITSASQILELDDLPSVTVDVPEWGFKAMVRTMTANERDAWESRMFGENKTADAIRANLVALCVIHPETKERVFKDVEIQALGQKSALAMNRLFEAASKLNGLSAKDVDELEKGSGGDQAAADSSS